MLDTAPEPGARILLVDDERDLLAMLHEWLSHFGYQTQTAANTLEALALFKQEPFDVVVTDLKMPGLDGLQLLSLFKELDARTEVIILSGQGTMEDAIQALRAGRAFDFLQKPLRDLHKLNQAIEQALARQRRKTPAMSPPVVLEALTEREREIVTWLAQGLNNREIAERICLSDKTIKNHLSRIYDKLGVNSRTQAVLLCQQLGMVE
ncbi:Tetrathionate response regulatory protein TtrR [compost metagenome]